MKEIRWHGRGGQGGFTAARLLGMAAAQCDNCYAQAFPSFGPERRGAPVLGFTRIDDAPIRDHSKIYECDYVVVLDASLLEAVDVREGMKPGGVLLVNSACRLPDDYYSPDYKTFTVDATSDALEILGQAVTNTSMFGALVAASELVPLEAALAAVDEVMAPDLREKNKKVLHATYMQLKKGLPA